MPIAVVAMLVAASLGRTGAITQTILANSRVSRSTLGVSASRRLGGASPALVGALTLSLASVASKSILPGAPFFLWLILRSRRSFW